MREREGDRDHWTYETMWSDLSLFLTYCLHLSVESDLISSCFIMKVDSWSFIWGSSEMEYLIWERERQAVLTKLVMAIIQINEGEDIQQLTFYYQQKNLILIGLLNHWTTSQTQPAGHQLCLYSRHNESLDSFMVLIEAKPFNSFSPSSFSRPEWGQTLMIR